jgi:hypothetical protein
LYEALILDRLHAVVRGDVGERDRKPTFQRHEDLAGGHAEHLQRVVTRVTLYGSVVMNNM